MLSATKSTYSLDAASLEKLNRLSRRWQVSKAEVLRRAPLATLNRANFRRFEAFDLQLA